MNILGIIPTERVGACEAYRCTYPLRKMADLGHKTAVFSAAAIKKMLDDGKHPWDGADVICFQRLTVKGPEDEIFFEVPKLLRAMGKTVLMDYDDDYTNDHRQVHDGILAGLEHFSAITVSTPYLKSVMKRYNKNVTVIPNLIVPEMFTGFRRVIDGLVIGLTGSQTHREDWKAVYGPLRNICSRFPEVKLFCSGYVPDELQDIPNLVTIRHLFPEIDAKTDNFFVPLAQYGGILTNVDILLCPVNPRDKFNWSKSNLKAIEGQASNCLVIASGDVPCYRDAIQYGKTGLFVDHNDAAGWESSIATAITDVELRHKLSQAGHGSALKNFNIHTQVRERVVAYEDIRRMDSKQRRNIEASVVAALAH